MVENVLLPWQWCIGDFLYVIKPVISAENCNWTDLKSTDVRVLKSMHRKIEMLRSKSI